MKNWDRLIWGRLSGHCQWAARPKLLGSHGEFHSFQPASQRLAKALNIAPTRHFQSLSFAKPPDCRRGVFLRQFE